MRSSWGSRVALVVGAVCLVAACGDRSDDAPAAPTEVAAVSSDVGAVPAMGWSTWAAFGAEFDADLIADQANALVELGLADAGYQYVNLDYGWMLPNRDATGRLVVDDDKFPGGLTPTAESVRALGLRFGIYTDASKGIACGGTPTGSYGFESQDFEFFQSIPIDYLKVDGCTVNEIDDRPYPVIAEEVFGRWAALVRRSDRPIYLLQQAPAYALIFDPPSWSEMVEWSAGASNAWRTGTDIANADTDPDYQWQTIVKNLRDTMPFRAAAGPGHFNDADFLIVGNGISINEARVQMASWAMLASPMIMSTDLRDLTADELALLTNPSVIAVSQDPLGRQADVVVDDGQLIVLQRPLAGGDWAVVVVNVGETESRFDVSIADLFEGKDVAATRVVNVFSDEALADVTGISVVVPRRDVAMFIVTLES